jgi:serine/threonine protein kinase
MADIASIRAPFANPVAMVRVTDLDNPVFQHGVTLTLATSGRRRALLDPMDFEVIAPLSAGEATESLLARDRLRDRTVVIERTHAHDPIWNPVTDESLARSRSWFAEHKKLVDRVDDPTILAVYDTGIAEGRAFAVKEYAEGVDLESWSDGKDPVTIVSACVAAARASEAAHAVGLCQLAPSASRIFVTRDGRVRVHAFGSLRAFGAGVDHGAPWNRAPESFPSPGTDPTSSSAFNDALTEQWGFAALIWDLVYRAPPVSRDSYGALVEAIRRGERDEPPASPAPSSLRAVLDRAMTVDRSARFSSLGDFVDALSVVVSAR